MHNLIDILPVGVFILDKDFHIADVNSKIEEYFCIPRAPMLGQDKRKLVSEKICHIFEKPVEFRDRILTTYDDNSYIESFACHVMPTADRQERWLQHSSQPIADGTYAGGRIEVYSDVTDRVLAEREIHWISTQALKIQEQDRGRIASNLHDGLGQTVLAIKFSLENTLSTLISQGCVSEKEISDLRKSIGWVAEMGKEISEISSNLMPSVLHTAGLKATLPWLKEQYSAMYPFEVNIITLGMGEERLNQDLEIVIFRLFQEGLNNIVKHSDAKNVELKLVYNHPNIIASITDDGKGFDATLPNSSGIGLKLMRQRIEDMKGTFRITSVLKKGTTIRAEIPAQ